MKFKSEKTQKVLIEAELRSLQFVIMSTPSTFPDRKTLLEFVNAMIALVVDGSGKMPRGPIYLLHLNRALQPLGYTVDPNKKMHRPPEE
jgi:hypothetical protein